MPDKEKRRCSICGDKRKNDWVAARHLEGLTFAKMERLSRQTEEVPNMKRETIGDHIRKCLGIDAPGYEVRRAAEEVMAAGGAPDVASLVQQQVIEKLEAGEARVTVQHGLQAQQLLDRRQERAKDRELAVTLARLLHSPTPPSDAVRVRVLPDPDDDTIEGEVVRIGP